MSASPETDKMLNFLSTQFPEQLEFEVGLAGFCRKMERERDEARRERNELIAAVRALQRPASCAGTNYPRTMIGETTPKQQSDPGRMQAIVRPCPFCGLSATIDYARDGQSLLLRYEARCTNPACRAAGPTGKKSRQAALDAWNCRGNSVLCQPKSVDNP